MLERMENFFSARLNEYDEHMLNGIESAKEFYSYTASLLPMEYEAELLDLGCGTGLELEFYYRRNGKAAIVGIDLSADMLSVLKRKFENQRINLICASYFDVPLEADRFSAAVSVESLHHFSAEQKLPLYKRLLTSLSSDGYFVLTDYFAESDEMENFCFSELARIKGEQGLEKDSFYHFDTPLTPEHEIEVLIKAGFSKVQIMQNWKATYTLLASR